MSKDGLRAIKAACVVGGLTLAVITFGFTLKSHAEGSADECLGELQTQDNGVTRSLTSGDQLCAVSTGKSCTFQLAACVNTHEAGCTNANIKAKKVKAKGRGSCGKIGRVFASPNGTSSTCGAFTGVIVKNKKRGKAEGTCTVTLRVKSDKASGKRTNTDTVTLNCMPSTATCPTTSTTTTTPVTSTTTTTAPRACSACAAEEIVTRSSAGTLEVSTLPAFPFPANVMTTIDTGPGGLGCVHDAIVPGPGGFSVPVFCIPALQFTSSVTPIGCESGGALGSGKIWDANDPANAGPSPDINRVGDTSDPDGNNCGTLGTGCVTTAGGAGSDTRGNINTTRGGNVNGVAGVHTQVDIPVHSVTWVAADASCPDTDGTFDVGTDTPITDFFFILSPTTGHTSATYTDLNGDGCIKAGNGPNTKVADGVPATGPCCTVGQATTVSATGIAFTGGAPLYDITFRSITPTTISACNPAPTLGTCVLTTDSCKD